VTHKKKENTLWALEPRWSYYSTDKEQHMFRRYLILLHVSLCLFLAVPSSLYISTFTLATACLASRMLCV